MNEAPATRERLIERKLSWEVINSWPTQNLEKSYHYTVDGLFHGHMLHGSQLLIYSVPSQGEHVEFETMRLYDLDRIDGRTELVLDELRVSFTGKAQGGIKGERFFYCDPDTPTRGDAAFVLEFPKRDYCGLQEAVGFSNVIKRRIAEIAAGEFSINT